MPKSADYLGVARKDLRNADAIPAIELAAPAARCAYFAAFHAAEAAIFEIDGKVVKTHSGVHSEYARLSRDLPELQKAPPSFLAHAYRYKQEGDYGISADGKITIDVAKAAIERAEIFVDTVAAFLDRRSSPKQLRT